MTDLRSQLAAGGGNLAGARILAERIAAAAQPTQVAAECAHCALTIHLATDGEWEHDGSGLVGCRDGRTAARPRSAAPRECNGHPAGPNDPMGVTVYCDGTCIG